MTLRFALLNLERCIGVTEGYWQYLTRGWKLWFPHSSDHILQSLAEVIREERIDVMAFTEIDAGSVITGGLNQVEVISAQSGLLHSAFFPTFSAWGRTNQGNAIISRYPITVGRNIRLPGLSQPRHVGEATLLIEDVKVDVLVTHLSLEERFRKWQIPDLARLVDTATRHVILAGDFNIKRENEMDLLLQSKLQKVIDSKTFPSWNPTRPLDHIFLTEELKVIQSDAYTKKRFSDHLMTIVDIQIGKKEVAVESLNPLTRIQEEPSGDSKAAPSQEENSRA